MTACWLKFLLLAHDIVVFVIWGQFWLQESWTIVSCDEIVLLYYEPFQHMTDKLTDVENCDHGSIIRCALKTNIVSLSSISNCTSSSIS